MYGVKGVGEWKGTKVEAPSFLILGEEKRRSEIEKSLSASSFPLPTMGEEPWAVDWAWWEHLDGQDRLPKHKG